MKKKRNFFVACCFLAFFVVPGPTVSSELLNVSKWSICYFLLRIPLIFISRPFFFSFGEREREKKALLRESYRFLRKQCYFFFQQFDRGSYVSRTRVLGLFLFCLLWHHMIQM